MLFVDRKEAKEMLIYLDSKFWGVFGSLGSFSARKWEK